LKIDTTNSTSSNLMLFSEVSGSLVINTLTIASINMNSNHKIISIENMLLNTNYTLFSISYSISKGSFLEILNIKD
jgi:hypothetical protein